MDFDEAGPKINILYIDSVPALHELYERYPRMKEEFRIDTSSSIEDALEKLWANSYNAIVTGAFSAENFEKISAANNEAPIIVLAGERDPGSQLAALFAAAGKLPENLRRKDFREENGMRFRSIFDDSPLGLEIYDPDGKLLRINSRCREIFGLQDTYEVSGFDLFEDPSISDGMKELLRKGETVHYEAPFDFEKVREHNLYETSRSGSIFLEVVISPVTTRGEIHGYIVQIYDITDRKKTEDALKDSERQYRYIFESFEDLYIRTDENGIITVLSPSVYDLLGWRPEELIGKPVTPFYVDPGDRSELLRRIEKDGFVSDYEVLLKKKDGTQVPFSFSASVITNQDCTPIGIKGSLRDISERKKAEKAINEANRKLNILSNITRHDINNQIMALYMLIDSIYRNNTDPKIAEYTGIIEMVADRIHRQIEFTAEYQDIGVESPCWYDVDRLIDLAEGQLGGYPCTVEKDTGSMEIYADPLVEKVFFNLLDNAARHGEGADTVTFSAFESDGTLTIVCEDNGAGIDREMREDLFRRGFGKNNGYGLYLIKEILSITGITIRESGETGRGARFEITVPKGCFRRGE